MKINSLRKLVKARK